MDDVAKILIESGGSGHGLVVLRSPVDKVALGIHALGVETLGGDRDRWTGLQCSRAHHEDVRDDDGHNHHTGSG